MKLQDVLCLILCMGYVRSIEIQKYVQLLKEPEYMNELPSLVSRCIAGLRETNRVACHDAEYLSKVHTMFMELSSTTIDISEIVMPPIVTLPTMGSYERIFLDYISVNKPLKSTLEQKVPVQDILNWCQPLVDTATSYDISLSHCESYTEIQNKLLIPGIAGNNYLLRLNESLSSTVVSNDINHRQQWPVITTVDVAATPVVQTCPQNMHMLVWGADKPLHARLFSSAVASVFNPILGSPPTTTSASVANSTTASTPLPLHVTSYTGSGYPRLTATLASLGVAVGNYRSAASTATFPSYSKVDLTLPEQYLFIPNDHLVSFYPIIPGFKDDEYVGSADADTEELRKAVLQAQEASSVTAGSSKSAHTTHLFKYCFVDASNLNKFKDALDISTGVSEHDQTALHILQSAFFDTKMNRFASENTLAYAIKTASATHDSPVDVSGSSTASSSTTTSTTEQPPATETITPVANRRQRGSQRTAAMANSGSDGAGSGNGAATSPQTTSTSSRATGSGNSFRDWQETNQWNTLIASLTMPRPPSPDIGNPPSCTIPLAPS